MILIVASRKDPEALEVKDYCEKEHSKEVRIIDYDLNEIDVELSMSNQQLNLILYENGERINILEFDSIWFRSSFFGKESELYLEEQQGFDYILKLIDHLLHETNPLTYFIINRLVENAKRVLGCPFFLDINKLEYLFQAKSCGLEIPDSNVLSSKKELRNHFSSSNSDLISKPINSNFVYFDDEKMNFTTTVKIDKDHVLNQIEEHFFPSLIQKYYPSNKEIKVLFTNGFIHSCLMLKEQEITQDGIVDLKDTLNLENPNSLHNIELPPDLILKIKRFMKSINQNFGVLDFILTKDNRYIFLELNPYGQYHVVTIGSGININRLIASQLCQE